MNVSSKIIYRYAFNNSYAATSYFCGQQLLRPLNKSLEFGALLPQTLSPGFKGQWSTSSREVAHRVMTAVALFFLLPPSLFLSAFGFGLSYLGNLSRRSVVVLAPKEAKSLESAPPTSLRVTTFNVAYMPPFVTVINGIRSTEERRGDVEQSLQENDDDIVACQEMFEEGNTIATSSVLRDKYPYQAILAGPRTVGLNSGLAIFSKYPLENVQFHRYKDASGSDSFANKGLLCATVRLSKDRVAFVFNTHLNAGHVDSDGGAIRDLQLEEAKIWLKAYVDSSPYKSQSVGTLFMGDFNIAQDVGVEERVASHQWAKHEGFFRGEFNEGYEGDGPLAPGETGSPGTFFHIDVKGEVTGWDPSKLKDWKIERECLDHILFRTQEVAGRQYKSEGYQRDLMRGSSDHLALRARFSLQAAT
jgi:exonuclease III